MFVNGIKAFLFESIKKAINDYAVKTTNATEFG